MTLATVAIFLTGCTRVDSTQKADSTAGDTTVVDVSAPPESVAAHKKETTPPIPQACPRRPGSTLVTSKGIGPAQLGMALSDLTKLCAVRDSALREDEGQPQIGRAISVGEGSAPILLYVDDAKQTVRYATTGNPFFLTTGGIGVGGTIGDLRKNHGRLCGGLGTTGIDVWAGALPNVVFGTTTYPLKMPKNGAGLAKDASAVPDTAHITYVAVSTVAHNCAK